MLALFIKRLTFCAVYIEMNNQLICWRDGKLEMVFFVLEHTCPITTRESTTDPIDGGNVALEVGDTASFTIRNVCIV